MAKVSMTSNVQTSFEGLEAGPAALLVHIAGNGTESLRGKFLRLVDAELALALRSFPMSGNIGMEIVLGQTILPVQTPEQLISLFPLAHFTRTAPLRILAHLRQPPKSAAERGVIKHAAVFELLRNRSTLAVVSFNRQFKYKGLRRHSPMILRQPEGCTDSSGH